MSTKKREKKLRTYQVTLTIEVGGVVDQRHAISVVGGTLTDPAYWLERALGGGSVFGAHWLKTSVRRVR